MFARENDIDEEVTKFKLLEFKYKEHNKNNIDVRTIFIQITKNTKKKKKVVRRFKKTFIF